MAKQSAAGSRTESRSVPAPADSRSISRQVANHQSSSSIITVRVPLSLSKRGGRKLVITPGGGSAFAPSQTRVDSTLIKAIARAHRWKRMLESGQYGSIAELAAAEKINQSYLCRVLRLTLLSPSIVAAILDGRLGPAQLLHQFMMPFPVEWNRQRELLGS